MCLQVKGIDNNIDGVCRVRWARGLSDDNGGVVRGRLIDDTSKGLEKTMEAAGARQLSQGIYDDYGGIGRER